MQARGAFEVSADCLRLGLRSGALILRDVHVREAAPALREEIAREVESVRERFHEAPAVRAAPLVAAFREVLRAAGQNPRKVQPSVERLLTYALKRGDLPAVNSLVDAYNLISMRSLCSLGAHDLDRIALPVSLRFLDGSETFTPLGQERPAPVHAGEFGYVDAGNRILCWLDVLQANFSKVTHETVNAMLIVEGTTSHSEQHLRETFAAAAGLITRHCGGTAEVLAT